MDGKLTLESVSIDEINLFDMSEATDSYNDFPLFLRYSLKRNLEYESLGGECLDRFVFYVKDKSLYIQKRIYTLDGTKQRTYYSYTEIQNKMITLDSLVDSLSNAQILNGLEAYRHIATEVRVSLKPPY